MNYNGSAPPDINAAQQVIFGRPLITLGDDKDEGLIEKQVDYMRGSTHYIVTHFILECCKKLEAKCITSATAACLFHKFFSCANILDYDPYLVAGTCIYLGGKVEDDHLKLRDVINVVHAVLHRTLEPLALGDEYWNIRDAIVQTELFVLRMVGFQVRFIHPHKYLLHYLSSIRDWMSAEDWDKYPLAETSWKLLQDLYHDPHVLSTDPSITALGIIQLTLEIYGIQIPLMNGIESGEKAWFKILSKKATKEKLWEVMTRSIEVYNKEAAALEPISSKITCS
ncbi:cyclin-Q [Eurytemora carolleeae]|uniref:cyclin-Q n=1 Tax=Eurytemora carolleeae TaxID=1294199 RepID=UPI000C75870E|nr:cyclin-Q [Eurytemora carolleeae]|eukprot:XP_023332793.1 cyclin-Q-like [Eurytemora affinis]